MALNSRSIKKLMQEHFRGKHPMQVETTAHEALGETIRQRLATLEGIDTQRYHYVSEQEKTRLVSTFTILDPGQPPYTSASNHFRLLLDEHSGLTIVHGHNNERAVVSALDELVAFVLHCKQRLARRQALQAKRDKVRYLQAQAIIAQVKQVAQEEQFDFMTEMDRQKLKLFVRLSDSYCLELHVPFKRFQEMLPQLRTVIVSLRTLYASGMSFKIVSRQALPWRREWIVHTSL
jgi:hypothetical protein